MKFIVSRENSHVSDKVIEKAKKKIGKFDKFSDLKPKPIYV